MILEIDSLGVNGEGVGRLDDKVIFVEGALPDESVEVEIIQSKKNYAVGKLKKILRESDDRVKPLCPLYEKCGGCQLQHLSYAAQLAWKRRQIEDAVKHIGKLDVKVFETLGMENPCAYRNKMQFPVNKIGGKLIVGCYERGSHKIVDTESCLIQRAGMDEVLTGVKKILQRFNVSAYDEDTHRGCLRHVMSRIGTRGEIMIVLVTATKNFPNEKSVVNAIRHELPQVTSIQQNIQTYHNNVILGRETKILYGKSFVEDVIGGLKFKISARSFFQVNTSQAEVLYNVAKNFAGLSGRETVIDAYCGIGTISLFMAKTARKVYGIEIVPDAINDAVKNARENKIRNAEFIVGDAVKIIPRLYRDGIRADVVIVDPPRAGCEKKVLETFAAMNPAKIVYVSCNPATLARDIAILNELGYRAEKIQPVDMFPFSSHIESVTLLTK